MTEAAGPERAMRIAKQSLNSVVYTALIYVSRFLLTLVLGKTLTTSEFGVYSVAAAAVGFFAIFLQLNVYTYYTLEIPGRDREHGESMFKSVAATEMTFAVLACLLVYFVAPVRSWLSGLLHLQGDPGLLRLVLALALLEVANLELKRYLGTVKRIEASNLLNFVKESSWVLALFAAFLVAPRVINLTVVLVAWAVGGLISAAYGAGVFPLSRLVKTDYRFSFYAKALQFGFPFLAASVSQSVLDFFDRFYLMQIRGDAAAGIYSYQYKIVFIATAFVGPLLANTVSPYLIEAFNLGEMERAGKYVNMTLKFTLLMLVPGLLSLGLLSKTIVALLAQRSYVTSSVLTWILLIVPVVSLANTVFTSVLLLERRRKFIAAVTVVGAASNIGLNVLLIPRYSYYGAAWATALSMAVMAVPYAWQVASSRLPLDIRYLRLGRITAAGVVSAAAGFAVTRVLSGWVAIVPCLSAVFGLWALILWRIAPAMTEDERRLVGIAWARAKARLGMRGTA